MAITPVNISRVSQNMQMNLLISSSQKNLVALLHEQEKLSTGLRIVRPSDDPIQASAAIRMDELLEAQQQYLDNVDNASKVMNIADNTLGSITTLTQQAHTLALENIGSTATTEQRTAASTLVDSIIGQMVTLGNTEYLGSYIFAGRSNTEMPFEKYSNRVRYSGDFKSITVQVAPDISEDISLTAREVFGTGQGMITGYTNLTPSADLTTRLADIDGALGQGIRPGTFSITGSAIGQITVDITGSATLGDVIRKINNVLPASAQVALTADGQHLQLTSTNPGETFQILESGRGTTAHDLGLYTPAALPGPITSRNIAPQLTLRTNVAALNAGAGIDLASGVIITNGGNSITLDFAGAQSVQDIINAINTSGVGVRAQINADQTGIDIINELAGASLTIGENGGTTAEDLGIRTFRLDTRLSDLNDGLGVHPVDGADFRITTSAGTTVEVDANGARTVQDIIAAINAAATAAGVNVSASLATTGNGIVLTDNTGGTGSFKVERANLSNVAEELGLLKEVPAGTHVINGDDVMVNKETSIFTYLLDLRDSLKNDDSVAIELAAQKIEAYLSELNQFHGKLGFMARGLETRKTQTEDAVTSTKALVSSIKDLDYTEAITKFQNLQTTLQANLQTGGQILNISLLDFLQ